MAKLHFGTKAETLRQIQDHLVSAKVAELYWFTFADWLKSRAAVLNEARAAISSEKIIIRSSAKNEDSSSSSHAGEFLSIANVNGADDLALAKAIDEVFGSYGDLESDNQVIIQGQVEDINMAGVLFTRDLDTLAPYYVINYDDTSGSTDSVTSGVTSELKTFVRFRCSPNEIESPSLRRLVSTVQELEMLFGHDAIDIEFAFTNAGELYIFQARPIVRKNQEPFSDAVFSDALAKVNKKIAKLNGPHPGLLGTRALYSVMTDWNPAEMIGVKPRPLALSLYKELITDSVWAYQRYNYGYRDLRSFPLLISLLGVPFIDVRASFNSFIPRELDEDIASKLVDYYTESLLKAPTDHDKVEFNIVFSCYYLNLGTRLKPLLEKGFNELEIDRIKFSLLSLTNSIISPSTGLYRRDAERIRHLEKQFASVAESSLPLIDKIYWLVEDCKRYGTLPFAGLARAGFIAMQFLRSLVEIGIFTQEDHDNFMNSLNTVAKQLSADSKSYREGSCSRETMIARYGHLRPGTYDILSPRYDEAFDTYFQFSAPASSHSDGPFVLTPSQREKLTRALRENGITVSVDDLFVFLKEAIEGREHSKFVFTRSVSLLLVLIEELGQKCCISRDELSYLDIKTLLAQYASLSHLDLGAILRADIAAEKAPFLLTQQVRFPQFISSPDDVHEFFLAECEPTFITQSRVTSIVLLEEDLPTVDLKDKIIFIKSADPGYDWIFSRQIGGLVTMFGGANSHMAIRCAELRIPAVIGCGEQKFAQWCKHKMLEIDCVNQHVAGVSK